MPSPTQDEYYATIDANLTEVDEDNVPAYDHVATHEEYRRFRAALLQWVADKDVEWDDRAIDEEHGYE